MKNLRTVINTENSLQALFGQGEPIDIDNLDQKDADLLFQRLDSNLSPEVLTCDGERPVSQQRTLYKQYTHAIAELKALGFQPSAAMYNV